ncbi:MAG: TraB domain-containing protein [Candidatus Methanospirareceae archaeon]
MITIIGTGHVFRLREKVKERIVEKKPEVVCLELDEKRYKALLRNEISLDPLALFQQSIAEIYGERAGNDMIGGIEGAKEVRAKIVLIDKDIDEIKEELMYAFMNEFLNPAEILRKFFVIASTPLKVNSYALFNPSLLFSFNFKGWLEGVIKEFERDPKRYRGLFGELYPYFKRILLDDREEKMAEEIRKVRAEYERIVVVTGAGHIPRLKELLSDLDDIEVIKLGELLR